MSKLPVVVAVACALLAILAAGCGSEEREGGAIEIAVTAQPDSLDPATAVTLPAVEALWSVYTPLLTYRHAEGKEGTELIPGLAEDLPEISADGRTYTLRLRDGLRYSDGTPVKASDFERTVKRVLWLKSPGTPFFSGIVGATEYAEGKDPEADIEGIETDDKTGEITIRLLAPDGTFSNVLATDYVGLVPGDTPFEVLTAHPPPGVGPFEIAEEKPGRQFVLERNHGFDLPGIPQAKLDRITVKVMPNLEAQTEEVIKGNLDFMQDAPPTSLLPEVRDRYSDRFREFATPAITYFFLNQRVPPFDNEDVRRAANLAVSREGMSRIYGGLMEPTCNFLPPQIPGYEKIDPCPFGDLEGKGDLAQARKLVAAAGAEGAHVVVWGPNEGPDRNATISVADTLGKIGLDAEPKLLDFSAYYGAIGSQKTGAQAGVIGFLDDFPHPADFMGQFNGNAIAPVNNFNFGNVDDPWVNSRIEKLKTSSDLAGDEDEWAAVDRHLIENADLLPIGNPKRTTFFSDRMDFENCSQVHPVFINYYAGFCLK